MIKQSSFDYMKTISKVADEIWARRMAERAVREVEQLKADKPKPGKWTRFFKRRQQP